MRGKDSSAHWDRAHAIVGAGLRTLELRAVARKDHLTVDKIYVEAQRKLQKELAVQMLVSCLQGSRMRTAALLKKLIPDLSTEEVKEIAAEAWQRFDG